MTQSMKDTVVTRHNQLRNKLAAGKTPKYPTASRMKEIVSTKISFLLLLKLYFGYCVVAKVNERP